MPQFSDDLVLGPVVCGGSPPNNTLGGPSPMTVGFGPLARSYVWDLGTPAALSATAICAAQAIAAAANAVINGTLAATNPATNAAYAVLPEPRALSMISTDAGDTTQTVLVTGTDAYGQVMSQRKTLNGTTIVNFTKAFKTVTSVAVSAVMTGNLTVGNRDAFGIPVYISDKVFLLSQKFNNTLAMDTGTVTVGDATSPATISTDDVRGLYTLSGVSDGSKRLVVLIALRGIQIGPNATRVALLGVTQV